MASYSLPYGRSQLSITIPESIPSRSILPNSMHAANDPLMVVQNALENPLGFSWDISTSSTVAITINDKTRPVPNHLLLNPLLNTLANLGIDDRQIKIWIATGSHLPMQPDEFLRILPENIIQRYEVISHNVDDLNNLEFLGTTSHGTPVWVNRAFYQADLKIVVGDIEPHHFAGFSGGYKSGAIGMAGRPTINHNHAMLTHPDAWIGIFDTNPLRQDIEEIGRMMNIQLALNAVLNQDKQIVAAFFGQPPQVSLRGIPVSQSVCGTHCAEQFDLVIASAGGQPKDINFYQAQKALTHASLFCMPGGTLILAAACPEGTGNRPYEEFMQGVYSAQEAIEKFSNMDFMVGPHKAYQVARLLMKFKIYLISDLPDNLVSMLLMLPAKNPQEALNEVLEIASGPITAAVLPHATTTIRIS